MPPADRERRASGVPSQPRHSGRDGLGVGAHRGSGDGDETSMLRPAGDIDMGASLINVVLPMLEISSRERILIALARHAGASDTLACLLLFPLVAGLASMD